MDGSFWAEYDVHNQVLNSASERLFQAITLLQLSRRSLRVHDELHDPYHLQRMPTPTHNTNEVDVTGRVLRNALSRSAWEQEVAWRFLNHGRDHLVAYYQADREQDEPSPEDGAALLAHRLRDQPGASSVMDEMCSSFIETSELIQADYKTHIARIFPSSPGSDHRTAAESNKH
jgi:hypothetical protein